MQKCLLVGTIVMDQGESQKNKGLGLQIGQHKRKYRRDGSPGFVADFADGSKIIGGIVENVSIGGFEIVSLPKSFTAEKHSYTVILSGGGKHYKMLVKPCWRKKNGLIHVDIGFKILDAPWEWVKLTMHEIAEIEHNKKKIIRLK